MASKAASFAWAPGRLGDALRTLAITFELAFYVLCESILGSVIIGSLQQIAQQEGFRGMYRGLSPTILALLPNWAVSIPYIVCFIYHRCMQRFLHKSTNNN
jgi:ABC-type dipeptide/oligopeptide/nickel transport system permease component